VNDVVFFKSLVVMRAARVGGAVMLLTLSVWGRPPAAQTVADSAAAPAPPAAVTVAAESVPLVIGNRQIFEFRANTFGYSPAERAAAAQERITEALREHPRGDMQIEVATTESPIGTLMQIDGRWMFAVTPGDVNPLAGETYEELVVRTSQNLEAAVMAMAQQRTASGLVRSIAFSLGATVLFWLLLRLLVRVVRGSGGRIERALQARIERLKLPPTALITQFAVVVRVILRLAGIAFGLGLTNLWATFVLKQFPYTYPWGDQLDDYLLGIGTKIGLGVLHAIPNLFMLVLIYVLTRVVTRWVRALFDAVREGRFDLPGVDAETAQPTQRLVTVFVWLLAVAIAYPYIPGSSGTAFKGLSVLFGIMLSLGSSNVMSQAASGYILIFSKALRVNDYIRIADYEGTVMSMGVLSTKIRTARDEEINVPNAVIVGSITKNFTRLNRETGAPLTMAVTIGYSAPWRQVYAMLLEAAARTPGVRKDPEPRVLQTSLSDFFVEYTLLVRLEEPQARPRVLSALNANVQDVFNEHGVQIMSPHYEGDPDGKVWVPREKWFTPPAAQSPKEKA
jgi:small-conductance mechanosensitive channel